MVHHIECKLSLGKKIQIKEGKLSPSNEEMKRFKPENEPLKVIAILFHDMYSPNLIIIDGHKY